MKQVSFPDGIIKIYQISEICEPGETPIEGLYTLFAKFRFEERKIGVTRNYMAMQNNKQIDRLIRIWQDRYIQPDFICTVDDGIDGAVQYRIARVEHFKTDEGIKLTDLTLERLDNLYELV